MNKLFKDKALIKPMIIGVILQIAVSTAAVVLFAFLMYFLELESKYSPVLGSVALAIGAFVGSYFMSGKKGNKGYILGLSDGLATFLIVSIVGLILNKGNITINTLFHLIIIVLAGVIGGILGVNRKNKSYI